MQPTLRLIALAALVATSLPTRAADDDALDLEAKPASPATGPTAAAPAAGGGGLRLAAEVAALHGSGAHGQPSRNGHRLGLDLRWSGALAPDWRFTLSNRLDHIDPAPGGLDRHRNSLREAKLAWQSGSGETLVEFGRINLRHGPAYGYNPTDYFRTGATRLITSADPLAIRENRLGTVMLRASQLWSRGSVALALAPKLQDGRPSDDGWSPDFGATNPRNRLLLTASARVTDRWNGEALVLAEEGAGPRLGLNVTGLLTDAVVLHGELSSGRLRSLPRQLLDLPGTERRRTQAALGATVALPAGWSLTAEAAYNGAGLSRSQSQQLFAQDPASVAAVLGGAQASQELASRSAWLLYATKKGLVWKQLDVAAFVRRNGADRSMLAWTELRYHLPRFDLALQWQRSRGDAGTEYGALPYRQVLQVVGTAFF